MFWNILTYRHLPPALQQFQILPLPFQRQMIIAPVEERVLRKVNLKPPPYPSIYPQELHKNLVALDSIQHLKVNVLWNEWAESELNIEASIGKLFNGCDPPAGGGAAFSYVLLKLSSVVVTLIWI